MRIAINMKMITIARLSRGLSGPELAEQLDVSKMSVSNWESKPNMKISEDHLTRLCSTLNFPRTFFMQPGALRPLPLSIRKRNDIHYNILNQIDANVNIYRLNLEILLKAINYPTGNVPTLDVTQYGTPQDCARELRKLWKIKKGPITNLSEVLEKQGIFQFTYAFDDQVDGRCALASDQYPLIVSNSAHPADRQRFTTAYLLGYLVMHLHTAPDLTRNLSRELKHFASEFLMPAADIKADLASLKYAQLGELKKKWHVSMISLIYRADDLQLLTEQQKKELLEILREQNLLTREPQQFDIPAEKPKLVRDLLTLYRTKQKLQLNELAAFLNLTESDFVERYAFMF